jgi:hypothetical protein
LTFTPDGFIRVDRMGRNPIIGCVGNSGKIERLSRV